MHTAAKVMLILGGVFTAIGIVMWVGGAAAADFDPRDSNFYEGSGSDSFDGDAQIWFGVYSEYSCDDVEVSVYDQNGDELFDQEYQCNDEDASGYTYVGGWYAEQSQTYTITSNEVVYVSDVGEEVGEAVGGFMAILGSWGVLCCGAIFLLLGLIFALTLSGEPQAPVVITQQAPQMMMATAPAATHMATPTMEQPIQYEKPAEYQQPAVEEMQPPQGGL